MQNTKSLSEQVRQLLKDGAAYTEVQIQTGASRHRIGKIAWELREQGYNIKQKTDHEMSEYLRKQMKYGSIGAVIDDMGADQLAWLMSKSTETWADAIKTVLMDAYGKGE